MPEFLGLALPSYICTVQPTARAASAASNQPAPDSLSAKPNRKRCGPFHSLGGLRRLTSDRRIQEEIPWPHRRWQFGFRKPRIDKPVAAGAIRLAFTLVMAFPPSLRSSLVSEALANALRVWLR